MNGAGCVGSDIGCTLSEVERDGWGGPAQALCYGIDGFASLTKRNCRIDPVAMGGNAIDVDAEEVVGVRVGVDAGLTHVGGDVGVTQEAVAGRAG